MAPIQERVLGIRLSVRLRGGGLVEADVSLDEIRLGTCCRHGKHQRRLKSPTSLTLSRRRMLAPDSATLEAHR
jgi:hypothetical protein